MTLEIELPLRSSSPRPQRPLINLTTSKRSINSYKIFKILSLVGLILLATGAASCHLHLINSKISKCLLIGGGLLTIPFIIKKIQICSKRKTSEEKLQELLDQVIKNTIINHHRIDTEINALLISATEKEFFGRDKKPKDMGIKIWNLNRLNALIALRQPACIVKKRDDPGTFTITSI